jgi:histone acetyltransferase (RNA polymerase elongator complex component)
MTAKQNIYPVFLPHAGCPFQCIYCNQHAVVSAGREADIVSSFREQLNPLVEHIRHESLPGAGGKRTPSLEPGARSREIAFYGGTFTALPSSALREILELTTSYVRQGCFSGIRFSTRPDCMSQEICAFLADYPVRTVELGVQSLSDEVLAQSRRGYTREIVERAVASVRANSWMLGVQLMAGLPGDTRLRFLESVSRSIGLGPDFVRIYPTVVLRNTDLAGLYVKGRYHPLNMEAAVSWCASAYDAFLNANIPIVRLGIQADRELEEPGAVLAGPYHPAFGYLVRVRWWRDRVDERLQPYAGRIGDMTIIAPSRSVSEILGPQRCNVAYWKERWKVQSVRVTGDPQKPPHQFELAVGGGAPISP